MKKPFLLSLLLLFLPLAAGADTYTWIGSSGDSWIDETKWSPATLPLGSGPGSGDDVIIATAAVITLPAGITNIAGLTLDASITLSPGTLNITGFLDIGSSAIISGTTYKSAAFTVAAGGVVGIAGNITTGGTVDVKAAGALTVSGDITGAGDVSLESTGDTLSVEGITSTGLIELTAAGNLAINDTVSTTGDVTITTTGSGTITEGASGSIAGDVLTISADGAVTLDNATNSVNSVSVAGGVATAIKNNQALTVTGIDGGGDPVSVDAAGNLTISGAVTTSDAVSLITTGDFISTVAIVGSSSRTLTLNGTGTLTISGGSTVFTTVNVNNDGYKLAAGLSAVSIVIGADGILDLDGNDITGLTSLTNSGTLKINGSGTRILGTITSIGGTGIVEIAGNFPEDTSNTVIADYDGGLTIINGTPAAPSSLNVTGVLTLTGGTLALGSNSITAGSVSQVVGDMTTTGTSATVTSTESFAQSDTGLLIGTGISITAASISLPNANTITAFAGNTSGSDGLILVKVAGALALGGVNSGDGDITVETGGAVTQTGVITSGGTVSVKVNGSGATTLNGSNIITGIFEASTTGTVSLTNAGALATGTISSGNLTINNTGTLTVGSGGITSTGTVSLTGTTVTLSDDIDTNNADITITGPITLSPSGAGVTLDTDTGGGDISLGAVGGAGKALTLTAGTGDVTLESAGTSGDRLAAVAISGAGVTLGGDIYTDNENITITGPITLSLSGAGVTLDTDTGGGDISLGAVGGVGKTLTLVGGTGSVTLGNAGASGSRLAAVAISGAGVILGGDIYTDNEDITITGPITLSPSGTGVTLDTDTIGGNISLGAVTRDATVRNLTLSAGTGTVSVGQLGETATALGAVSIASDTSLTLGSAVYAASFSQTGTGISSVGGSITTGAVAGDISFGTGTVTIDGAGVVIIAGNGGNGDISFGGDLTAAGEQIKLIANGTGTVTVSGTASVTGTATDPAIDIEAANVSGTFDTGAVNGNIIFKVDNSTATLTAGTGDIQISTRTVTKNILVGNSDDFSSNPILGDGTTFSTYTPYAFFDADNITTTGSVTIGDTTHTGTIYVTTATVSYPLTLKNAGDVFFNGDYSVTNQNLTVAAGTNTVTFAGTPRAVALGNGTLNITGDVYLAGNTVTAATATSFTASGGISISGAVAGKGNGVNELVLAAGTVTLGNTGTAMNGLAAVVITGTAGITLKDNIYTHDANITITGPVTLDPASGITLDAGTGNIGFSAAISGAGKTLAISCHEVSFGGSVTTSDKTISVTGDFDLSAFAGATTSFDNATVTMEPASPASLNVPPPLKIKNLIIDPGNVVTLAAHLNVAEDITINATNTTLFGTLEAGALLTDVFHITLGGDWIQADDGIFVPQDGTVEFTASKRIDKTVEVIGLITTWNNFACATPGATIKFSNHVISGPVGQGHYIDGQFNVDPGSGAPITLTRLSNVGASEAADALQVNDNTEAFLEANRREYFWNLYYHSTDTGKPVPDDLINVIVKWSWARNNLSLPDPSKNVTINPFNTYHNVGWKGVFLVYSYTEDIDHNGKIDRIRIQASGLIYGAFSENIEVEGYALEGIPSIFDPGVGTTPGMLFVKLKEKDAPDTNARPRWRLSGSSGLYDDASLTNAYTTENEWNTPIDTAPPRISYALALPGKDEIFVRMSEPVNESILSPLELITISGSSSTVTAAPRFIPGWASPNPVLEFLLPLSAPLSSEELISGTISFSFDDGSSNGAFHDAAPPAVTGLYPMYFPTAYGEYSNDLTAYAATGYGPPNYNHHDSLDTSDYEHRATDVLISAPPQGTSPPPFFIQPLWARNANISNSGETTFGVVRQFDSTGRIQNSELTIQAMVDASIPIGFPGVGFEMVYSLDTKIGGEFRSRAADHGLNGLWLPRLSPPPGYTPDIVPSPFTGADDSSGQLVGPELFNFTIPYGKLEDNTTLEFYLRPTGITPPSTPPPYPDLYIARLDMRPGEAIPLDWYRRIKPFSLSIVNIPRQRSGVTILNNVINPNRNDRAFVNYSLTQSGRVTIQVFTMDGTLVKVLERGNKSAGEYSVSWDGKNNGGRAVARGLYFIRVVAPDIDEIRKVMVVK